MFGAMLLLEIREQLCKCVIFLLFASVGESLGLGLIVLMKTSGFSIIVSQRAVR